MDVRRVFASDAAYAVLDAYPETRGCTWSEGGCRVAAEALHLALPGSAILALYDDARTTPQVEHYIVDHGGRCYDADGARSRRSMLAHWRGAGFLTRPRIGPFVESAIPNPPGAAERLARLIGGLP